MANDSPQSDEVPQATGPDVSPQVEKSASQTESLGKATGSGFSWLTFSLLIGKACIFLALMVLGSILTKEDFGVFAIAASVIGFIKILHDGGVPQVLVQRGNAEFVRLQGAALWIALLVSLGSGIVLAAIAPWIASVYGDERLTAVLWVLAVSLPLGAPTNVFRARLQLDLRFRIISMIAAGRFFLRSVGMVVLALLGYGVMSFVLPLLFVAFYENTVMYLAARSKPWKSPVRWKEWPGLLKDAYWVVFASVCRGMARYGSSLVLGLLLSQALLGLYFFGFQLTIQITYLVALNLRLVLFPVMTKLADDPQRQSRAILRSISVLMLVAAPTSMIFASVVEPLEMFIWHGKWSASVPLMQIFATLAPLMIVTDIVQAALNSRGQFRLAGYLTFFEGCWLMLTSWLAVFLAGDSNITGVAAWSAGLQVIYVLIVGGLVLRRFQINFFEYVHGFLKPWGVAAASFLVTLVLSGVLPASVHLLIQIPVLAVIFFVCFSILAQLLLRSELQRLADVAPKKIAGLVRLLFLLRPSKGTVSG